MDISAPPARQDTPTGTEVADAGGHIGATESYADAPQFRTPPTTLINPKLRVLERTNCQLSWIRCFLVFVVLRGVSGWVPMR